MAERATPIRCPKCDHVMNHHADKLVEPRSRREAAEADAGLGGLVLEMHGCPNCGNVESRPGR